MLVLLAVQQLLRRSREGKAPKEYIPAISVLKPLAGDEPELAANLDSFFQLNYPRFEALFAAGDALDPALATARQAQSSYPDLDTQVLVAGESDHPNAKVHSLAAMTAVAVGELLVVSDSDIRADPALLRDLASDFEDPKVGVVTCPYRAVPGSSFWSTLEALGMNTEFWSGVLVAQFLTPMDFAVGPTMAVRRSCLDAIGGWAAFRDYLAEDFQVGRQARLAGYEVRLSTHVVNTGSAARRWARTSPTDCAGDALPVGPDRLATGARSSPIRCRGRCCCRSWGQARLGHGQFWARASRYVRWSRCKSGWLTPRQPSIAALLDAATARSAEPAGLGGRIVRQTHCMAGSVIRAGKGWSAAEAEGPMSRRASD